MKKSNLNEINQDIYDVFEKHNITEQEMLTVYKNCLKDFEMNFQIYVQIEDKYLNMLRDIIWYNFERNDENNLSRWGSVYKNFMFLFEETNKIEYDELDALINELTDIKKRLSQKNIYATMLVGKDSLFEDANSQVDFIDKRKDKKITNKEISSKHIICYVSEDIASYDIDKIKLYSLVDVLLETLKKAKANNSKVEAIII